jgi:hypothetical protein
MWQIMCGYLIVVKVIAKIRLNCKCYINGQKMNMYMLIVYIIHNPFGYVMLSHDLWLDVGCQGYENPQEQWLKERFKSNFQTRNKTRLCDSKTIT